MRRVVPPKWKKNEVFVEEPVHTPGNRKKQKREKKRANRFEARRGTCLHTKQPGTKRPNAKKNVENEPAALKQNKS